MLRERRSIFGRYTTRANVSEQAQSFKSSPEVHSHAVGHLSYIYNHFLMELTLASFKWQCITFVVDRSGDTGMVCKR